MLVRDGHTIGEGFHHRRGEPHAEVEALRAAGGDAHGATLYVSLEPCDHAGLTPPCTAAVIGAGIARVVVGALDPNPRTAAGGVARLRAAGIEVEVRNDPAARALVERFAVAVTTARPFVTLKMAASVDGRVGPEPGRHQLTGSEAAAFVRELRAEHDAVMVGAGTVAVDDSLLTVRPPRARLVPYRRVVVCDRPLPADRRIFAPAEGYAPTIVLCAGPGEAYGQLEAVAEVVIVQTDGSPSVDLEAGLVALKQRGVQSVLCEGGPRLAARLVAAGLVDRLEWLIAPVALSTSRAVAALGPLAAAGSLDGRRGAAAGCRRAHLRAPGAAGARITCLPASSVTRAACARASPIRAAGRHSSCSRRR